MKSQWPVNLPTPNKARNQAVNVALVNVWGTFGGVGRLTHSRKTSKVDYEYYRFSSKNSLPLHDLRLGPTKKQHCHFLRVENGVQVIDVGSRCLGDLFFPESWETVFPVEDGTSKHAGSQWVLPDFMFLTCLEVLVIICPQSEGINISALRWNK